MLIGEKLRKIREARNLSQGDIEQRTGLLRCYTSRVENGHTVPAIQTLEKYARALEIPLYKLFHDGTGAPKKSEFATDNAKALWGETNGERRELHRFANAFSRMDERSRKLLMQVASRMAGRTIIKRK